MFLLFAQSTPAPVNTVAPAISGIETEGETLTCSTGTWTGPGISYSYQWERSGTPIGGATNNTYVLQTADVGETLTCVVTATNEGGEESAESAATGVIAGLGAVASLEFSGTNQYLTQTDSDFGNIDFAKYAIVMSINPDTLTQRSGLFVKAEYDAFISVEDAMVLEVDTDGALRFLSRNASNTLSLFYAPASTITTSGWYSIMIHFDSANATSGDRIKMWVNGSAVTAGTYIAPTGQTRDTSTQLWVVGAGGSNSNADENEFDGLIYSASLVSGTLPDPADVFDGTAGKLKNLTTLTGLHSLLTGATATDDHLLIDWTNNGTVTTNASVP